MKKIVSVLLLAIGLSSFAQEHLQRKPEPHKEWKNLNPEERKKLFQEMRVEKMLSALEVEPAKKESFKNLLQQYFKRKEEIVKSFNAEKIKKEVKISNQEALKFLDKSFDTAQKILDYKKQFKQKFLEILTPQQVLQLYKLEKDMKDKIKGVHKEKCEPKSNK